MKSIKAYSRRYKSDNDLKKEIDEYTNFLSVDALPLQRAWHYFNKDQELKFCACGDQRQFKPIVYYQETCGNRKCIAVLVKSRRTKPIKAVKPNIQAMKDGLIKKIELMSINELQGLNPSKLGMVINNSEKIKSIVYKFIPLDTPIAMAISLFKNNEKELRKCICGNPLLNLHIKTCGNKDCASKVRENTVQEVYGSLNIAQSFHYLDIKKKKRIVKYESILLPDEILNNDGYYFECKCNACKKKYSTSQHLVRHRKLYGVIQCTKCNPVGSFKDSAACKELCNYISALGFDIQKNNRTIIKPYELDIVMPDKKIAIEYNGLFHHGKSKSKDYHKMKTDMCKAAGYQLIHIWSDDWINKKDIVLSIINSKLGKTIGIAARKCKIVKPDAETCKKFLDFNHIQGFVGANYSIGLEYEDRLVMLMTFGKQRIALGGGDSIELLRMCALKGFRVIGGASKLFKNYINETGVKEIISYSDNSRNTGGVYEALGFTKVDNGVPNYWYVDASKSGADSRRLHRFAFRKDVLVSQGFDINKTESEIMSDRNYYRIYDCGSSKYVWTNK